MAKWYEAGWNRIEEVEVIEETKDFVIFEAKDYRGKHFRLKKITDHVSYFKTREEAKQWLIKKTERYVTQAKDRLERAEGRLRTVKEL